MVVLRQAFLYIVMNIQISKQHTYKGFTIFEAIISLALLSIIIVLSLSIIIQFQSSITHVLHRYEYSTTLAKVSTTFGLCFLNADEIVQLHEHIIGTNGVRQCTIDIQNKKIQFVTHSSSQQYEIVLSFLGYNNMYFEIDGANKTVSLYANGKIIRAWYVQHI